MYKKIQKFQEFKETSINEGFLDKAKELGQKLINKLGNVFNVIKEWITPKKITTGPKKGAMTINYIEPSSNMVSQLDQIYSGTEFVDTNRLKPAVLKENLTAEEEKALFEEETWRSYPTTHDNFEAPKNVNVKVLKRLIKSQYKNALKNTKTKSMPTFIFGAPGIGKTQIIAQVASELGIPLIVFEVQNMDASDFKGLGTPATYLDDETLKKRDIKNKDSLVYLRDEGLFPTEETSENGGIIFMDEFPNADEDVIKKLNLFIGNGIIDSSYKLPQNWIIVGAGNRPGDQEDIYDFSYNLPAAGRWKFVHFTPRPEDWIEWARDNNEKYKKGEKIKVVSSARSDTSKTKEVEEKERTYIIPDIIDLIEIYDDIFYNLDPDKNPLAHASPRSWEALSVDIKQECENEDIDIDEWHTLPQDILDIIISTHVGKEAENVLKSYLEIKRYLDNDDIIDIFKNPMSAKYIPGINPNDGQNSDPSKIQSLSVILINVLDKFAGNDINKKIEAYINMLKYILRYETGEPVAYVISMFQDKYPELNPKQIKNDNISDENFQKLRNIVSEVNSTLSKANKR